MESSEVTTLDAQPPPSYDVTIFEEESLSSRIIGAVARNKLLFGGALLILAIVLFAVVGTLVIDPERAEVGYTELPRLRPSGEYWLGSDQFARDIFAYVAFGTFGTLWMGLIAGIIGIGIGTILGFLAGYFGGWLDTIVVILSDALITIPGLMLLITISAYMDQLSVEQLGILIGVISWMGTTRVVRAQVLTLKNRAYVEVSKFNGQSDLEIVVAELIPNLAPFIAAAFRRRGRGRNTAINRTVGARSRPSKRTLARTHGILVHPIRRRPARSMVVVRTAHRRHRNLRRRPLHGHSRT